MKLFICSTLISLIGAFLFLPLLVTADEIIEIHFFDDRLCPVCREAKSFVETLAEENSQIELFIYPISDTGELSRLALEFGLSDYSVMAPTIFVGQSFFQFNEFGSRERGFIERALSGEKVEVDKRFVKLPFLDREISLTDWPLLALAVILGSIDGFNICSIGALMLILSIVVLFESKKKIFLFGGLFILTTVFIYGSLVFLWAKLFELLIGQLEILRLIVGLAALGGGIYFLSEFWRFFRYGPTCRASAGGLAEWATIKLQKVFSKPGQRTIILSLAVVLFAAIITIVELPCSIGIPLAFAGVLAESGLSGFWYLFYILIFLFFYMLIEMVIFTGAVLTKRIWFVNSRVITLITFMGAMILFYLAFYYLFT